MKLYYGVVENNKDPLELSRVQVRVHGIHSDDKAVIPTEDLIWSLCMGPVTSPGISGLGHNTFLVQGSWVVGTFLDNDYQDFMVIGTLPTTSSDTAPNSNAGFADPDGIYPKELSTPDNNIRVRDTDTPYIKEKDEAYEYGRVEMVPLFDKDGVEVDKGYYYKGDARQTLQPPTKYAPEHPTNKMYATESGHFKEYDDTVGAERIHERHKSGSSYEIEPNGSKIERVVNNNYKVVFGHDTLEVTGNVRVIITGNSTVDIGGDATLRVVGDSLVDIGGNAQMVVGGNFDSNITGTCNITSGGNMTLIAPKIDLNP